MGREKRDGTVRRIVRGGGVAEVVPDRDRENAFLLLVDGTQQSHVDLADPSALEFEYMRRIAAVLDLTAPPGDPLRVLHLGGGALSLPRYLAATRPGSTQRVVEIDGALVELIRETLPLPKDAKIRVRVGDAREVVTGSPDAAYDVVIGDVFDEARTPAHLTSVEFVGQVARVLRPDGRYILNMADSPPLRFGRNAVATVRAVLPELCLIADATVLRGRRYGNLVVAAGRTPLPLPELRRRMAGDWFPSRVEAGPELDRFADGGRVVTDADAESSPPPPELLRPERPEI
ncbi:MULTISPECIES: spermidine synthase [Catenuloplanes]|uniref:Spermidine synthase n=1 Tax=Catenuloplanes niger TaxID=587534 RepID=A0AAE4CX50_9ACTN|nr:fused MFS/spermidine synthase [Catenuloplanes niger]MDR7324449.1 spermidine synthase [Catenuloplanes niger]